MLKNTTAQATVKDKNCNYRNFAMLTVFQINFSNIFLLIFVFIRVFGELRFALCKILELLGQDPQRNYLSKSATFDPNFQLLHSAIYPITGYLSEVSCNKPKKGYKEQIQTAKEVSTRM